MRDADFGAADISLCSGLQFCVAPQVVPTAARTAAGQPGLLRPRRTCFVASARTGYANRPKSGNWRYKDFHLARSSALSAAPPPPASPPPAPKCSSCSIGLPDPLLPSAGPDWGQARPLPSPPLPSPAQVLVQAFRSASPPAPPSLPWNLAAPGRGPSSVSSSVHSSFENCYSFSRVDLLISNCTL